MVVILLVTSCWVSCDGLVSHPGGVVILLVTSCWVSCDGLLSHPGGSSSTPSHLSRGHTSDFLLVQVMRFFQILSRRQREMKIACVATLELATPGEKIARKKSPELKFSRQNRRDSARVATLQLSLVIRNSSGSAGISTTEISARS